jgi:hypothetical protein
MRLKNHTAKSLVTAIIACATFSCNTTPKQQATRTTEKADTAATSAKEPVVSQVPNAKTMKTGETAKADTAEFQKKLSFKNITFLVKAKGKGSLQELSIQSSGLAVNDPILVKNSDPVVNAEIADLNGDGFPELLIYTQSAGSGSYGKIHAYSVNNGKSISSVYFAAVSDNPKIRQGYMGHDRFEIVNNKLTQRFPIYSEGDPNNQPSGKTRIITYNLAEGEASRKLVVEKVTEQ